MQPEITVTAEIAERATRNGKQTSLATGACNERGTIIISEDGELDERRRRPTCALWTAAAARVARVQQEECEYTVKTVLRPEERRKGQRRDVQDLS